MLSYIFHESKLHQTETKNLNREINFTSHLMRAEPIVFRFPYMAKFNFNRIFLDFWLLPTQFSKTVINIIISLQCHLSIHS